MGLEGKERRKMCRWRWAGEDDGWIGEDEGWVDGGGSVRTKTRDGSMRMRDGSVKWLACMTVGLCVEGWFWTSLAIPSPYLAWAWHE